MPAGISKEASNSYSKKRQNQESKSLSAGWVFYSTLQNSKNKQHRQWYNAIKRHYKDVKNDLKNPEKISEGAQQLRRYAQAERQKEISLLKENFGINFNLQGRVDPKDLTDALNGCLQLKEAYERNINRITAGQAKIDITMFFESYFKTAWGQVAAEREQDIADAIDNTSLINKLVTDMAEEAYDRAWNKMWDSDTFKGWDDHTYQDLKGAMGHFKTRGTFSNQIWNLYNLDGFQDKMSDYFHKLADTQSNKQAKNRAKRSKTKAGQSLDTSKGNVGEVREQFITFLVNEMGKINFENGDAKIKVQAVQTGMYHIKPDEIFSIGVDMNPILSEISKLKIGDSRKEFKQAFDNIYNNYIKGLDGGFIIYTNSKNYTLVRKQLANGYVFSGFSAGTPGDISFLKQLYKEHGATRSNAFFNAVINAGSEEDGAVTTIGAEVGLKKELETILAQDIAWFLFDDYDTIGQDNTSAKVLHIMDLDGIFFPLSVFLDLCADAFDAVAEKAADNPRSMVDIQINPYKVMYPEGPWGIEKWKSQRAESIKNTEIMVHFFSSFTDQVNDLLRRNK